MDKRVILTLMEGNFEQGFRAILRISSNDTPAGGAIQLLGKLPPALNVLETFKSWQLAYHQLVMPHCRIKAKRAQITNISCLQLGSDLLECLNEWLNSGFREWQNIRDGLQRHLSDTDEIEVIVQTSDRILRQLPWHLWDFFEHYPLAEVALSAPEYQPPKKLLAKNANGKVRILAILGNSQGIDIEKDRAFLEQLSAQAEIEFLVEPHPEKLNDCLWEKGWDILFFAGHSSSKEKGQILLNQNDVITLDQLRYALKKAIAHGLRLAIFNSCEGLGLAQDLEDLHIGQVIVMREPVPDVIAQAFLRYFLTAFSGGKSLYASVREARERLQKLEGQYPYATWLPVICQNPAEVPPTWQELCGLKKSNSLPYPSGMTLREWERTRRTSNGFSKGVGNSFASRSFSISKPYLHAVLLFSVVVTALVMGVRQWGVMQLWELLAFDQLMRLRPDERPDPRLLLVTVTEKDVQSQNPRERRGSSLSDRSLAQLLEKLQPYQPQVIGLDLYRDFPIDPQQANLETYFQQNKRLIAVCEVGDADEYPGVRPPPGISAERLGFSDFPVDPDGVIRRQLLGMAKDEKSFCQTDTSFSFRVAQLYLAAKGIQTRRTSKRDLQIGSTVLKKIQSHTGGYHRLNVDAQGFQVLLNYRSSDSVAKQVTLTDILSNSLDAELPNLVKNRIVLIGTTARSFKDYFPTPDSTGQWPQKMPGVVIQAHMVSQILSAVLDQRPLLWWWPSWGESVWVWCWSLVGGALVWYFRTPLYLGLASGTAICTLCGACFFVLLQGGWIPLIPSAIALVATGASVVIYATFSNQEQQEIS